MNRNRIAQTLLLVTLGATVALVGCRKKEEPAPAAPAAETAPTAAAPAPSATVSITALDLGNAIDAGNKVPAPTTTFSPKDTIYASVTTTTSDPAATVPARIGAKWTFQDGQTVQEDPPVEVQATNGGVTAFSISNPDGFFPVGKYKVEISLDDNVVQSREFEVK